MFRICTVLALCLPAFAQPAKVDFGRDVAPIFRQNCIGCHGPNKQTNGLRVDQRSSVMKPGSRRIQPGNAENSLLLHRLTGNEFGMQMPPTGPLKPEQIATIKAWIEQGAPWPDALANEKPLPPIDPKAVSLVETLRTGDMAAFHKTVSADPKLLNARGPEGSTPFMYAVLYADAPALEHLIKQGANVNAKNDAGATALMWAALDLAKTKVLVDNGADVNAKSADFRTPLMIAAGRQGNSATVKLLLAHKANPNPGSNVDAESTPFLEAALAGDFAGMQALQAAGADVKSVAGYAMPYAYVTKCMKCVDLVVAANPDAKQYTVALELASALNVPSFTKMLLDHGADPNALDPSGRTALLYAATTDQLSPENIKLLVAKGADVKVRSGHAKSGDSGLTALDMARMHGNTPVVDVLVKAGAPSSGGMTVEPAVMRSGNTIQKAVESALTLLQTTDANFPMKAGCFSCHNNSITEMAVAAARRHGFRVNEKIAAQQIQVHQAMLTGARDVLHQGMLVPVLNANPVIIGYVLTGFGEDKVKADLSTDAVAMFIQSHQALDGSWPVGPEARPPLCGTAVTQAAIALRALQLYSPNVDKAAFQRSVQRAADWLSESKPDTHYETAFKLLGLSWAGRKEAASKVRAEVLAMQRADGGWGDLATMESNAFTTGLAMVALQASGLPVTDAAYQKGVKYLLATQHEDGSWHVKTRAAGFQPYFENGFPHGVDQFISAAGTGWATMALSLAAPSGLKTNVGE